MIYLFNCLKCENFNHFDDDTCELCKGCINMYNPKKQVCPYKCANSALFTGEIKDITQIQYRCKNYKEKGSQ